MRPVCIMKTAATLACLLSFGCATNSVTPEQYARLRSDVDNLQQEVASLNSRLEDTEASTREMNRNVSAVRGDRAEISKRMDDIERNISAVDKSRESDKKEIVSKLSSKIVEVVNKNKPAPVQVSDTGYEHVVQPGESLSKIASKYGVRSDAIMQANGLANPDVIRAGQKLFIPAGR